MSEDQAYIILKENMSEDQAHFKANANIIANSYSFFSVDNTIKVNEILSLQPLLVKYSASGKEFKDVVFIDLLNKDVVTFANSVNEEYRRQILELYFNNNKINSSNTDSYLKEIQNLSTSI